MLDPSKKLVYAVESVVDIAYNGGSEPVRSREIAKRQGVPHRYLEQVMQRLVHAGVLQGPYPKPDPCRPLFHLPKRAPQR